MPPLICRIAPRDVCQSSLPLTVDNTDGRQDQPRLFIRPDIRCIIQSHLEVVRLRRQLRMSNASACVWFLQRNGSSLAAIKKYVGDKYKAKLPGHWEKMLSMQLKRMADKGQLIKVCMGHRQWLSPASWRMYRFSDNGPWASLRRGCPPFEDYHYHYHYHHLNQDHLLIKTTSNHAE